VIEKPGEHDFCTFMAKKGQVFDIRCFARQLGSPLDASRLDTKKDGTYITGSDDSEGSPDSYFRFTAPEDEQYIVGDPRSFFSRRRDICVSNRSANIEPRLDCHWLALWNLPISIAEWTVPKGNPWLRWSVFADSMPAMHWREFGELPEKN